MNRLGQEKDEIIGDGLIKYIKNIFRLKIEIDYFSNIYVRK